MQSQMLFMVTFWLTLSFYTLGIVLTFALPNMRVAIVASTTCAGLGSFAALMTGIGGIINGTVTLGSLDTNLPFGALSLHLDRLSAFFLATVGLIALPAALYALGELHQSVMWQRRGRIRIFGMLFNCLLLSVVLIVVASDMIVFLIAWETMAFLSYFLVCFEYEEQETKRAAYQMLAVSEIGTVGILIAFLLLYQTAGNIGFDALHSSAMVLAAPIRSAVFLLALFGFGAKIGVLPLQLWMPDAYRAAPGFVAVILAAVLINLGIYGLLRFCLDFLGGASIPLWWGMVVLLLGATTALVGILYAVVQRDLKRVLAYSSVENMGLVLTVIGASLIFQNYQLGALAAIAMIVALYHLLNHAVYKGLLFMGAGSIQHATGSSAFAKLGGLLRRMPWTGLCFIVAALSISAVPPLNGYISEWMLLETLLQSFVIPDTMTKIVMAVAGAMLALTAGIAVTAFVRATGISLLALPRSKEAEEAREAPTSMRIAMGYLAFLCLLFGVLPTLVLSGLDRVTSSLLQQSVLNQIVPPLFTNDPGNYQLLVTLGGGFLRGVFPLNGLVVVASPTFSTIASPSYLFLAEALFVGLVVLALRMIRPLGARRIGRVWAGGIPRFTAAMTYTDLAYSNPIRIIFQSFYRSQTRSSVNASAAHHRDGSMVYEQEILPPFEQYFYQPLLRFVNALTRRARIIQSGNMNQYVGYIFLIVLLILILRAI